MAAEDQHALTTSPSVVVSTNWNASHGFVCGVLLIASSVLINESLRVAYGGTSYFASWARSNSYLAQCLTLVLRLCVLLWIAYVISRVRSVELFVRETGFSQRPTFQGWLLAWFGIGIGCLNLYFVARGTAGPNSVAPEYSQGGEATWAFFVVETIMLSPFVEETIMRGFLYKAFRQSYGIIPGIMLVHCVQVYFHWKLVAHNPVAFALFLVGGIALCLIREYTESSWNCVMFHAAYNATVIRQWPICIIGMVVLLACFGKTPSKRSPENHEGVDH